MKKIGKPMALTSVTIHASWSDSCYTTKSNKDLNALRVTEGYVCERPHENEYTVEVGSPAHKKAIGLANAFLAPAVAPKRKKNG